ncbi:response regulator transcription factor [Pseudomonas sp. NPDC090233]|uniref:response regulator transcription factor n=1 Tax=Pseudomonas sp. NPDC090233 TaxID=3364479 RepID=UPI00383A1979
MKITDRESDVIRLLGQGMTNKQIGLQLGISHYTVRDHISSMLKKLNMNSRVELAILVLRSETYRPSEAEGAEPT